MIIKFLWGFCAVMTIGIWLGGFATIIYYTNPVPWGIILTVIWTAIGIGVINAVP